MNAADRFEWRYVVGGTVKHALSRNAIGAVAFEAECGLAPGWWRPWLGSGTQIEHDVADALPRCKRCVARIGRVAA